MAERRMENTLPSQRKAINFLIGGIGLKAVPVRIGYEKADKLPWEKILHIKALQRGSFRKILNFVKDTNSLRE